MGLKISDWLSYSLTELRFYVLSNTNLVISEMFIGTSISANLSTQWLQQRKILAFYIVIRSNAKTKTDLMSLYTFQHP